jgi:hypothetical protein
LLTKSLEPLGIPALTSSSPLIEWDLGGTVGPDGEVDSRSTLFLGRIPSFAISQPWYRGRDLPGSIFPAVDFSGLPTAGLLLPPIWFPDRLLCAGIGSSDISLIRIQGRTISISRLPSSRTRSSHRSSLRLSRCSTSRFRIKALGYRSIITSISPLSF